VKKDVTKRVHAAHQFLALDQPLVDFIQVEDVLAGKYPNPIAFRKLGEAYRTLNLLFEPRMLLRSYSTVRRGGIFIDGGLLCCFFWRSLWGEFFGVVFFPCCSRPNTRRKVIDDVFRCAIALCSTSNPNAVHEKRE
jgi:hypothetical protein